MRSPWFWILIGLLICLAAVAGWRVGLESGRAATYSGPGKIQRSLRRDGLAMRIPRARKPAARPEKDIIYVDSPNIETPLRALEQPITITFDETPLNACIKTLAELAKTTLTIDEESLQDEGIKPESTVSVAMDNVRLEAALRSILTPLNLSWTIRDERLVILSEADAESAPVHALYPVGDLVTFDDDHEILIETLQSVVDPDSWDNYGGPGTVAWVPQSECLAIRQSWYTHRKVHGFLRGLREAEDIAAAARSAASAIPDAEPKPIDPADPAVRTSREILQENIQILRTIQQQAEVKSEANAK